MLAAFDGEFQLGTDAVIGRDQQRVVETRCLQVEKAAKSAEISIGSGSARGLGQRRNRADQGVAGFDRDASLGVGI